MKFKVITSASILIAVIASSCKGDEENTPEFDKIALLTNVADKLIIPSINDFESKISSLKNSYLTFESGMNINTLNDVRTKWREAYISWQAVKIYDFGPIMNNGFKASTGTFPTDTNLVQSNISAGSYDLNTAANIDAIGLSALDYLFYNANALDNFVSSTSYRTYTRDLILKMESETQLIQSQWSNYRSTFIASTGTEATSSFSLLVNEFNKDYEIAKNAKLGIPIGKQSLGIQMPEYLEARFSGISFDLLLANVESLYRLYNGISTTGANGVGFDDYLLHLEKSDLSTTINSNFNTIISSINGFPNTLEESMSLNPVGLDDLYTLMQGQVVKLKTDMTSSFGVLITYQDNDGD